MSIALSTQQLLAVLVGLLPMITGAVASTAAGFIRQDGLPPIVNSLISVMIVAFFAALNVLLSGKLTGNYSADFVQLQMQFHLLTAGSLHLLTPYVQNLQSNVFAILHPKPVPPSPNDTPTQPRLSVVTGGRTSQAQVSQANVSDNIGG